MKDVPESPCFMTSTDQLTVLPSSEVAKQAAGTKMTTHPVVNQKKQDFSKIYFLENTKYFDSFLLNSTDCLNC